MNENQILDLCDSLERLKHNVDFKKVISIYLCKDLPVELVDQLNQFPVNSPSYNELVRQLDMISMFTKCFTTLEELGQTIRDNQNYLAGIPFEDNY